MSNYNYGSKHQMENERWLWMPNETMALNAKWKTNNGSERQMENEQWLWMPKVKTDGDTTLNAKLKTSNGSERQTKLNNHDRQAENDDSERRN